MINKARLYFHTLKYLRIRQLLFYFIRRILPDKNIQINFSGVSYKKINLNDAIPYQTLCQDHNENSYYCLNESEIFAEGIIDWHPAGKSRLWHYQLHYFDFLRDTSRSLENKRNWIDDWIRHNPQGTRTAWEAYPVSLRLVNLVRFIIKIHDDTLPKAWLASIYEQAMWLETHMELHILANHYFENIKALLYCSYFLDCEKTRSWMLKAEKQLFEQLDEQFLDDGCHYERSPQYHCRMMENVIDLLNLYINNNGNEKVIEKLDAVARRGMQFLSGILSPAGHIPLFNDSTLTSDANFNQLKHYYQTSTNKELEFPSCSLINFPDAGYYGWHNESDSFIIDCGDIGPAYQPGHTHCDFLAYELYIAKQPVIVDSGVYEYSQGKMRDYVRSTRAHNTIQFNNDEQSEIWGEFRVARRARKIHGNIEEKGASISFTGQFQGFYEHGGNVQHQRQAIVELAHEHQISGIQIRDSLSNFGADTRAVSRIHCHPDVRVMEASEGELKLFCHDHHIVTIRIQNYTSCSLTESWYCPEFGQKFENTCIEIELDDKNMSDTGYDIIIIP